MTPARGPINPPAHDERKRRYLGKRSQNNRQTTQAAYDDKQILLRHKDDDDAKTITALFLDSSTQNAAKTRGVYNYTFADLYVACSRVRNINRDRFFIPGICNTRQQADEPGLPPSFPRAAQKRSRPPKLVPCGSHGFQTNTNDKTTQISCVLDNPAAFVEDERIRNFQILNAIGKATVNDAHNQESRTTDEIPPGIGHNDADDNNCDDDICAITARTGENSRMTFTPQLGGISK